MLAPEQQDAIGRAVQAAAMMRQLRMAQMPPDGSAPPDMPPPTDVMTPPPPGVMQQGQAMAPPEEAVDPAYAQAGWGTAPPMDYGYDNTAVMPQPGPPPEAPNHLKAMIAGAHRDPKRAAALSELGAFLAAMGKMHAARHKLQAAHHDAQNPQRGV